MAALLADEDWVSVDKFVNFLPGFRLSSCLLFRYIYGYWGDRNGRLSPQLKANATSLYDLAYKITSVTLNDTSIASEMCGVAKDSCYPKTQMMRALSLLLPCMQQALKDAGSANADLAILTMTYGIKVVEKDGYSQYIAG